MEFDLQILNSLMFDFSFRAYIESCEKNDDDDDKDKKKKKGIKLAFDIEGEPVIVSRQKKEAFSSELSSPEDQTVTKILMDFGVHGSTPSRNRAILRYLQSPAGLELITTSLGGPEHDSGDSTQRVLNTLVRELSPKTQAIA